MISINLGLLFEALIELSTPPTFSEKSALITTASATLDAKPKPDRGQILTVCIKTKPTR